MSKADAAGSNCLPQVASLGSINALKGEMSNQLKRVNAKVDALHGNTQKEINLLYSKLGDAAAGLRKIAARDAA